MVLTVRQTYSQGESEVVLGQALRMLKIPRENVVIMARVILCL